MAFRSNVRSRVPSRGARRSTTWSLCSMPGGFSALAANTKAIAVLFPSTTLLDLIPFTIVRTRLLLSIGSDQQAASETIVGAFGAGIVNDVAGALGVTGLPGPTSDCGWAGWFAYQPFLQEFVFGSGVGLEPNFMTQYVIDSKAMRKVAAEEDIVWMIENDNATAGLRFAIAGRMLIKAG